jgi:hypothetical protein
VHVDLRDAPPLRVSKVRLVFGPADSVATLLRALADALDPLDVVPREVRCSITDEGCRLLVTCELDPEQPDLARVLGRLLRRRRTETPPPLAWSA